MKALIAIDTLTDCVIGVEYEDRMPELVRKYARGASVTRIEIREATPEEIAVDIIRRWE